ncbi:MAG TPA: O-antigen ligase family protein [Gaiellaceae bacterium]
MHHEALADAAAVVGALGAVGVLLARNRLLFLAGIGALVLAEVALSEALVPDAPRQLTDSTARLGLLGLAVVAGLALAAAFIRVPAAAPVALLVVAPFRLSVGLGKEQAFLLLPFYAVLVAAVAALAWLVLRGKTLAPIPALVGAPAGILVALSGVSLLWAHDPREGTVELLFFYFPFALLVAIVARTPLREWSWRALATALVAVTSAFAAIGIYQAWSHTDLIAKQDVQLRNAYASFFRVTSVFQDPSVYGRHLVLGIVVLLSVLWLAFVRPAVALPLLALLAVGLFFSYSQTSFVALFAAVLVVTLMAGDALTRRVVVGVSVALVVAAGIAVFTVRGTDSAGKVTSDRLPLARLTWPVFVHHPVVGVGIGSQPLMSRREANAPSQKKKNVSHTTPLTVAAELGTIGLLVYLAFLAALGRALLFAWRRHRAAGLALAGSLTALVVQSLFYGGFFEDPFVWGIAGLAAAVLTFVPELAHQPARAETGPGPRATHAGPLPARPPDTPG